MRVSRFFCALLLVLACTSKEDRLETYQRNAEAYFEQEQWSEAKIEYLNLLQLDPGNADAHYKMGRTLWNLGEFRDAAFQLKEAARLDPENDTYSLEYAQTAFLLRDYDEALREVAKRLERDPEDVEAMLLRARVHQVQDKQEEQLADLNAVLEIDPDQTAALAFKAQLLARQDKKEEAEATLKHLVKVHPTTASHMLYGIYLSTDGRSDEAVAQLEAAVEAAETSEQRTQARLPLLNLYLNRKEYESAEAQLLKAREESPDNTNVLLTLAQFYALRGESDRAEAMLKERIEKLPDDPGPRLVLADFYTRLGKRDEALEVVNEALELEPSSEQGRLRRAEYLLVIGEANVDSPEVKEAERLVTEVLEENPNSLAGLFTEAKFLIVQGKHAEAATRLRRVIEEKPTANAHVLLGSTYLAEGQAQLARAEFLQALQLDADHHVARTQLAALYLATGERSLAQQEAEAGLERRPGSLRLLLIQAEAFTGMGRNQEALAKVRLIQLEESTDYATRLTIASLYRRNGDFEGAQATLRSISGHENDASVIAEHVRITVQQGDTEQAIAELGRAIEKNPDEAVFYEMRGDLYRKIRTSDGKLKYAKEAERDLKTALEKDPQRVEALVLLAELYRSAGRDEDVIESYKRAVKLKPDAPGIQLALGSQYEAMGRIEEARQSYETVLRLDQEQPIAMNNLAWILADAEQPSAEDLDRALQLAQEAKSLLPRDPSVADTLGWVMYKKNLPGAAIPLFKEAIEGYPAGSPQRSLVQYHLAQTYERNGEPDRAIQSLKEALEASPSFPEREEAAALLKRLSAG